jgi:hypothetical protein
MFTQRSFACGKHPLWAAGSPGCALGANHLCERQPSDGETLWHFVASLTMDDLLSLLAHCASLSLDAVQRPGSGPREAALGLRKLADEI